jgi:hypothetical protein
VLTSWLKLRLTDEKLRLSDPESAETKRIGSVLIEHVHLTYGKNVGAKDVYLADRQRNQVKKAGDEASGKAEEAVGDGQEFDILAFEKTEIENR